MRQVMRGEKNADSILFLSLFLFPWYPVEETITFVRANHAKYKNTRTRVLLFSDIYYLLAAKRAVVTHCWFPLHMGARQVEPLDAGYLTISDGTSLPRREKSCYVKLGFSDERTSCNTRFLQSLDFSPRRSQLFRLSRERAYSEAARENRAPIAIKESARKQTDFNECVHLSSSYRFYDSHSQRRPRLARTETVRRNWLILSTAE